MEFEDVDARVEWEARRVAAAFGVKSFQGISPDWMRSYWGKDSQTNVEVRWDIDSRTNTLLSIHAGEDGCEVNWESGQGWWLYPQPQYHEQMVRGLYRLGFEDEGVLSQLPSLTTHEKLELRLSMPREFWPKKWLDEEGISCGIAL